MRVTREPKLDVCGPSEGSRAHIHTYMWTVMYMRVCMV